MQKRCNWTEEVLRRLCAWQGFQHFQRFAFDGSLLRFFVVDTINDHEKKKKTKFTDDWAFVEKVRTIVLAFQSGKYAGIILLLATFNSAKTVLQGVMC